MKQLDDYASTDEMMDRITEILREEGEPEGEFDDEDGEPPFRELQGLAQAVLTMKLVERGVDVNTAVDLVLKMDTISCSVDSAGVLRITSGVEPNDGLSVDVSDPT